MATINNVELDWKAQDVLEALVENGGEATTSEVKSYTGLERNEVIKYRFGKLAEAGLVETHQPEARNGRPAAKVARLTDAAEELLDGDGEVDLEVEVGDDDLTIDERMERLEKQMAPIRETYGEVKKRVAELEEAVEEHDEELDGIAEEIRNVKRAMDVDGPDTRDGDLASELEFGDD
ncbi:helix-turn-helix domain-containing protein [Halopenitus persicus]|uniref:winged helix DNA-binding protein n=1 Tax=Halopenitus persicus TaxID=1048396 RepID=UPI0012FD85F2|nr:winged helix DNA-binding protein [Halopenitus persicus]